jgi:hypothetical protein
VGDIKKPGWPGMAVYTYNPSTWEAEAGGSKFQTSFDYIGRTYQKTKQTNKKTGC